MRVLVKWLAASQVGPFTTTRELEQLCPLEHVYITTHGDLQLCAVWKDGRYLGGTIPIAPENVISMAYYTDPL
mgnify:FL=1